MRFISVLLCPTRTADISIFEDSPGLRDKPRTLLLTTSMAVRKPDPLWYTCPMPPADKLKNHLEQIEATELPRDQHTRSLMQQWMSVFSTQRMAMLLPIKNTFYPRDNKMGELFAEAADEGSSRVFFKPMARQIEKSCKIAFADIINLEKTLKGTMLAQNIDPWQKIEKDVVIGLIACARYRLSASYADAMVNTPSNDPQALQKLKYPMQELNLLDQLLPDNGLDVETQINDFNNYCQNLLNLTLDQQDPEVRERLNQLIENPNEASFIELLVLEISAYIAILELEAIWKQIGLAVISYGQKYMSSIVAILNLMDLVYDKNNIQLLEPLILETFTNILVAGLDILYHTENYPEMTQIITKISKRLLLSEQMSQEVKEAQWWLASLEQDAPVQNKADSAPAKRIQPIPVNLNPIYKLGERQARIDARLAQQKIEVSTEIPKVKEPTKQSVSDYVQQASEIQELCDVTERAILVTEDGQIQKVNIDQLQTETKLAYVMKATFFVVPRSGFITVQRGDNISQLEVHDGDYRIYVYKFGGKFIFTRGRHGHNTNENWKWNKLRLEKVIDAYEQLEP